MSYKGPNTHGNVIFFIQCFKFKISLQRYTGSEHPDAAHAAGSGV